MIPLFGDYTKKSVGIEPLLVPPIEALASAHLHRTNNVQSPRVYAILIHKHEHLPLLLS